MSNDLAKRLNDACVITGAFVLRSGQVADTYFDKYRFEAMPELLVEVAERLVALVPSDTEVLGGLELGGVPIATALSIQTGLPTCFVRKEAKTYGTANLAEGAEIDGRRVLVVEDVITTGGQVASSVADLRERGAIVDTALCVVHRGPQPVPGLVEIEVDLKHLFTLADLQQTSMG